MPRSHRLTIPVVLAAAVLAPVGCAAEQPGAGTGAAASATTTRLPPSSNTPPSDPSVAPYPDEQRLPDLTVTAIDGGGAVRLSSLAPAATPVLVWFWAPSCVTCNAEAPSVEQFSRAHAGDLAVVGLGAKDSLGDAEEFVERYGLTTPRMLYDASFASWKHFGMDGQPAAILFDRDGVARERWFGPFDEDEVLAEARALA